MGNIRPHGSKNDESFRAQTAKANGRTKDLASRFAAAASPSPYGGKEETRSVKSKKAKEKVPAKTGTSVSNGNKGLPAFDPNKQASN